MTEQQKTNLEPLCNTRALKNVLRRVKHIYYGLLHMIIIIKYSNTFGLNTELCLVIHFVIHQDLQLLLSCNTQIDAEIF